METGSTYTEDDPRAALALTQQLSARVRQAQRATWFPLLVLAAITFIAIPVDRLGGRDITCRGGSGTTSGLVLGSPHVALGLRACLVYSPASTLYWPIALVLAYVAIALFYLHRAQARGVGTRVRPYVVAGIVIAVVASAAGVWVAHHPPVGEWDLLGLHLRPQNAGVVLRMLSPAFAIGLALLVLARVERSAALLAVSVVCLVVVLMPVTLGWVNGPATQWIFLPRLVIDGSILLLAALAFALAERATADPPAADPAP